MLKNMDGGSCSLSVILLLAHKNLITCLTAGVNRQTFLCRGRGASHMRHSNRSSGFQKTVAPWQYRGYRINFKRWVAVIWWMLDIRSQCRLRSFMIGHETIVFAYSDLRKRIDITLLSSFSCHFTRCPAHWRIEIAATGPIPGRTPTKVPTAHPIKANERFFNWKVTETA